MYRKQLSGRRAVPSWASLLRTAAFVLTLLLTSHEPDALSIYPLSLSRLELQTIHRFPQSRRRSPLGPSPAWIVATVGNMYIIVKIVKL